MPWLSAGRSQLLLEFAAPSSLCTPVPVLVQLLAAAQGLGAGDTGAQSALEMALLL